MIITLILSVVVALLSLILNLIPDLAFTSDMTSFIQPFANVVGYVDMFISIPAILMCLSAILIVDNFDLIVKVIAYIWDKIPFV